MSLRATAQYNIRVSVRSLYSPHAHASLCSLPHAHHKVLHEDLKKECLVPVLQLLKRLPPVGMCKTPTVTRSATPTCFPDCCCSHAHESATHAPQRLLAPMHTSTKVCTIASTPHTQNKLNTGKASPGTRCKQRPSLQPAALSLLRLCHPIAHPTSMPPHWPPHLHATSLRTHLRAISLLTPPSCTSSGGISSRGAWNSSITRRAWTSMESRLGGSSPRSPKRSLSGVGNAVPLLYQGSLRSSKPLHAQIIKS